MWARQRIDKMISKTVFRLLTVDLDDTLWPCAPTIRQAEAALYAWLARAAPRLTEACNEEAMRLHRHDLMVRRPQIAHDLTAVRRESLQNLLAAHGYDAELAAEAMVPFLEYRNRVEPYADVIPALLELGVGRRLVAVTNGNSDVERTPLRGLFHHALTAADVGARKPDPALFVGALEWGGTPPAQALHLGDDPYLDVEAARSLGMQAVWVNRGDKVWPDELEPPVLEVTDLAGLGRWLEGLENAI
jgi:putative hydrolase of the HAD superfamily